MPKKDHVMSIAMTKELHDELLQLRCRPEYRNMSIGALIRMLIEKGLKEQEK